MLRAALKGDTAAIRGLLNKGISPDAREGGQKWAPLMLASRRGHDSTVRALIEAKAKVDARHGGSGWTSLMLSVRFGHVESARLLIDAKADPSAATPAEGYTPLILAGYFGKRGVADLLLETGASVDTRASGSQRWTALLYASRFGHAKIASALLRAGADPDLADADNFSPLAVAAYFGHTDVAKALLDAKADMERSNKDGDTPLALAARKSHFDIVRLLLSRGADFRAKNKHGQNIRVVCEDWKRLREALRTARPRRRQKPKRAAATGKPTKPASTTRKRKKRGGNDMSVQTPTSGSAKRVRVASDARAQKTPRQRTPRQRTPRRASGTDASVASSGIASSGKTQSSSRKRARPQLLTLPPVAEEPPAPPSKWTCVQCTLENDANSVMCVACGYKKRRRAFLASPSVSSPRRPRLSLTKSQRKKALSPRRPGRPSRPGRPRTKPQSEPQPEGDDPAVDAVAKATPAKQVKQDDATNPDEREGPKTKAVPVTESITDVQTQSKPKPKRSATSKAHETEIGAKSIVDSHGLLDSGSAQATSELNADSANVDSANVDSESGWHCTQCTLFNSADSVVCKVCGFKKPRRAARSRTEQSSTTDGHSASGAEFDSDSGEPNADKKRFRCALCGKRFKRKQDITRHMLFHSQ